jgi:hypothetical protein
MDAVAQGFSGISSEELGSSIEGAEASFESGSENAFMY